MDFLRLTFNDFEFRDLGHSDFLSFKVLALTLNDYKLSHKNR